MVNLTRAELKAVIIALLEEQHRRGIALGNLEVMAAAEDGHWPASPQTAKRKADRLRSKIAKLEKIMIKLQK